MKRRSESQTVLDQYRASLSPLVATRQRVWDELAPRAAAGEPPSLGTSAPPPALPVVPAGLAWSPALVAGALGASALLIVAAWSWRTHRAPVAQPAPAREAPVAPVVGPESVATDPPRPARQSSALPVVAESPQAVGGGSLPAGEHEVAPRVRAPVRTAEPLRASGAAELEGAVTPSALVPAPNTAPARAGSSFARFGAAPNGPVPAAPERVKTGAVAAAPQLDEELRLLRNAYEALHSDRPERALTWLGEHAARFPRGALAEAREVARIMALCQAGQRETARAEAARFLQLSPRSPHAGRVRSLCVDASEPP